MALLPLEETSPEWGWAALQDRKPVPEQVLHRLLPEEEQAIVEAARVYPDLRHRKLAAKLADEWEVSVNPSTVYRVLKRHDLIASWQPRRKAQKEFVHKTQRPNELWQIDICYIPIEGQDHWYLISVLDDYLRKIMNHELYWSMTARDVIRVIDGALLSCGLVESPPKFLTDNGSQMTSHSFREYVRALQVKHLRTAFRHPETIGKIERYHRTIKEEDVFPKAYADPFQAQEGIRGFVRYYNEERPHEALGNVTPEDRYAGREKAILARRERLKRAAVAKRKRVNCACGRKEAVVLCET